MREFHYTLVADKHTSTEIQLFDFPKLRDGENCTRGEVKDVRQIQFAELLAVPGERENRGIGDTRHAVKVESSQRGVTVLGETSNGVI